MARVSFKGAADYALALKELEFTAEQGKLLEDAVKAGADPVADEIRNRLVKLPHQRFVRLGYWSGGRRRFRVSHGDMKTQRLLMGKTSVIEKFRAVPTGQKKDLLDSMGITPIRRDKRGFVHVKVGFDGYGSFPTKTYPDGVPNALLARSVESGSSVREKTPFVRPAVNATRKQAVDEMEKVIVDGLKNIFE